MSWQIRSPVSNNNNGNLKENEPRIMAPTMKVHLEALTSSNATIRYESFQILMEASQNQVDWAYDAWDMLLSLTKTGDNHQRTIAVQLLANLAKSDPDQRMPQSLDAVFRITHDEKFVTARHSLQCLWKIGIVNDALEKDMLSRLSSRFETCIEEKNGTLVRFDITEVLKKMYDQTSGDTIKEKSLQLIDTEEDTKYRKKYLSLWKEVLKS